MRLVFFTLAWFTATAATLWAQAPTIAKVEPPEWWVGHSINPVRLLIRGKELSGARFSCAPLECRAPRFSASGTYAFIDVVIPAATKPGRFPVTLRTAGGSASFEFAVHAPLARAGRFQGFGKNDVIYMLMPDRFANGDPSNDDPAGSRGLYDRVDPKSYHGGDLEGVRQRLPYLKGLGITVIWLTPLYENVDSVKHREALFHIPKAWTDYHGYGATDLYGVEEHFGDLSTFKRLVDDAHALGLKVILDQVANHTGPEHIWTVDPPTPTWYSGTRAKHLPNNWQIVSITDPHAAAAVLDSTLHGWFANVLPDLNQDDPEVARYLIQNTLWWAGVSGIDGIRQDTWPYVPRSFWRPWMAAIKREYPAMTVVAEMWGEDPAVISFAEGTKTNFDGLRTGVDHLFDFPVMFTLHRAFGRGGSVREVAQMVAHDRLYDDASRLVTFVDNHDVARFLNDSTPANEQGLRLAYTFVFTARGIPMLYYGNEIAMPGRGDPDNRHDFPGGWPGDALNAFEASGRDALQARTFDLVQRLIALRTERPELRSAPMEHLLVEDQLYVYRRGGTVVAINNAGAPMSVRVPGLSLARAAVVGGCGVPRADGAGVVIELPARTGCVF